jgi:hypothetical protein
MIEQGHRASEAVAAKLGYAAFERVAERDERPLIVYRREAGANVEPSGIEATSPVPSVTPA